MFVGWEMGRETACCQTDPLKNVTSLSRSQRSYSFSRYPWSMQEYEYICIDIYVYIHIFTYMHMCVFLILGGQNSNQMDCPRGNSLSKVHLCQWCLELRNCNVGSCILWRETLLGDDQSGRKYRDTLSPSSCDSHSILIVEILEEYKILCLPCVAFVAMEIFFMQELKVSQSKRK